MVVPHGEPASTTGDGTEVDGVAQHLRGGHQGGDRLLAHGRHLGALHPTAPGVEITHHVALVGDGDSDLEQRDRLQQDRPGLGHGFAKPERPGHLEAHLGGVHGM